VFKWIKKKLYFPIAYYFRLFAQIQLLIWKPEIIVVTGSTGKTTLLHFIESQLGEQARYSHHANSAYGVPFNILGLKRTDLLISEWLYLFLSAPLKAFKKPYKENLYVVEADCDRPGEGKFLSNLLKPEITLWTNSSLTHSVNFDKLVSGKKFSTVEKAVAHEYGYFLEQTASLAIINGDCKLITGQLKRLQAAAKIIVKEKRLNSYKVTKEGTEFKIDKKCYLFSAPLPRETFYSIVMTNALLAHLKIKPDYSFSKLRLPPGRSSVFKGIKNITVVDSSYNATSDGMAAILKMFDLYPAKVKWAVLGDMLEQGVKEQEEHERLAELIASVKLSRIILMGPRVSKYTYPKLKSLIKPSKIIEKFLLPKESLDYLLKNIQGGEAILFKGARFLEGVIEHLLLNKDDVKKLCRREKIWQIRRRRWGL
jgi:UDP-N-acetylmuramoyl-tripeptide--D-alanyl-D-alanine ligase